MVGKEEGRGHPMRSEEPSRPFDAQNVENEAEQMGLAQLSRQSRSPQHPVIEFAIVEDDENDKDQDEDDGNVEYDFFTGLISNSGDEAEDEWENSASDSDDTFCAFGEVDWLNQYGGWSLNVSSRRYEPFYRFVQPDPRTSCNAAAAALKEPISLLTKYRYQRLGHQSKYFHKITPRPSKALCLTRQVRRGSHLKKVRNVDDQTLRWA